MMFPNATVTSLVERRFQLLQHLMLETNPASNVTIRSAMRLLDNELISRRGYAWGPSDYVLTDAVLMSSMTPKPQPCEHPGVDLFRHVPGDLTRFNDTEHCWTCNTDVPAREL